MKAIEFVRVTRTEVGRVYVAWGNVDGLRDTWAPEMLAHLRAALDAGETFDDSSDGDVVVYYPTTLRPLVVGHDAEQEALVCAHGRVLTHDRRHMTDGSDCRPRRRRVASWRILPDYLQRDRSKDRRFRRAR